MGLLRNHAASRAKHCCIIAVTRALLPPVSYPTGKHQASRSLCITNSLLKGRNYVLLSSTLQCQNSQASLGPRSVQLRPSHVAVNHCAFSMRQAELASRRLSTAAPGQPASHGYSDAIVLLVGGLPGRWLRAQLLKPTVLNESLGPLKAVRPTFMEK